MDAAVKVEKLRYDERLLQTIDKCIRSRDDHYERIKGILKEILEDVFTKVKGRDGFFREQFQEFFFVEKHYKGTTLIEPVEFDVNVIIKIPLNRKSLDFERVTPGYTALRVPGTCYLPQWDKYRNFLSKWLVKKPQHYSSPSYELDAKAFRQSIESLFAWAILNVPRIDNYTVKVHKDGPAFTLSVIKQGFPKMKVNLMPVLEFDCRPPLSHAKEGLKWYAVPEPLEDVCKQNCNWRVFLYNHENDILTRHSYLMPIIRQLEKLRETRQWKAILHYHIKTLVMQYAKSMETESELPDTCKLIGIHLFIHMLFRLRNMCETQHLENFWDPKHNLIKDNPSQFADIGEELTIMINEITDDPAKMVDWILMPEELSMYENELEELSMYVNELEEFEHV